MVQADRMTALDAALGQLPDRQREAVVLRHIEGLVEPRDRRGSGHWGRGGGKPDRARQAGLAAALAGQRAELGYEEG